MSAREKSRRALQAAHAASSVEEFCTAHGISRGMFYKMTKAGIAPRTMKVGTRTLITNEAAADWRREREAAAAKSTRRHNAEAAATPA